MNTTNILATEILAHITQPRALRVGDLAVFETYDSDLNNAPRQATFPK